MKRWPIASAVSIKPCFLKFDMAVLIFLIAAFFAMNMGGSSFAASFAAACGGKLIRRQTAIILFIIFVILGAVSLGHHVSITLGRNIVSPDILSQPALVIIFLVAGMSMFAGNIINIPQSTSLVTVAAIAGVGIAVDTVNFSKIFYCLIFWILLPLLSYLLTWLITGYIYPPRARNFWVYEKYINQRNKLKWFAIIAGCYCAFSVGANNVANVVGPLNSQNGGSVLASIFLFAVVYGSGSLVFTGAIKTIGEKVVPLGLLTVSIISMVSGSLMIVASAFGVPQSFVMLQMGSLFAVSVLKKGTSETWNDPVTRRTLYSWTINPVVALLTSFILSRMILK